MFVLRKNGKLRLCADFQRLNGITMEDRYPLPNISESRDELSHAKIFTALDLRRAYNFISTKKGEEWKTTFRTRYGHYEYTVMPFGLTNAPATCQTLVNNVLRENLDVFVIAYLDGILIYSQNEKEHKEHVRTVLRLLQQRSLLEDPNKCKWYQEELEFLGCIVRNNGVKMSPEKIQVVKDWPAPTTVKDVAVSASGAQGIEDGTEVVLCAARNGRYTWVAVNSASAEWGVASSPKVRRGLP
jgi:hypothetical protein